MTIQRAEINYENALQANELHKFRMNQDLMSFSLPSRMIQELRLHPNEEATFATWFRELSQGEQRAAGAVAAGFLKKSNLPQQQLKEIWDICDSGRLGSIDRVSERCFDLLCILSRCLSGTCARC